MLPRGKGLAHHMSFVRTFPGSNFAAARDISRLISAHASRDASRFRFAFRFSGCLGSDHAVVFGRGCLDSRGFGFSRLLLCGWAVFCCGEWLRGRSFSGVVAARLPLCALDWRFMSSRRFAAREVGLRLAWSRANSIGCCVAMCARKPFW